MLQILINFACISFFFFKQKTAYEILRSDWSSDVFFRSDRLRRYLRFGSLTQTGPWLGQATDETLRELADGWNAALQDAAAGHPRVTDKMPGNFALLGLIHICL